MDIMNGKDMARMMSKHLNSMSNKPDEFIEEMGNDHRTLQQSFTRLCVAWIEHLAKQKQSDLRNDASVKFAKKVVSLTTEEDRWMPFI